MIRTVLKVRKSRWETNVCWLWKRFGSCKRHRKICNKCSFITIPIHFLFMFWWTRHFIKIKSFPLELFWTRNNPFFFLLFRQYMSFGPILKVRGTRFRPFLHTIPRFRPSRVFRLCLWVESFPRFGLSLYFLVSLPTPISTPSTWVCLTQNESEDVMVTVPVRVSSLILKLDFITYWFLIKPYQKSTLLTFTTKWKLKSHVLSFLRTKD